MQNINMRICMKKSMMKLILNLGLEELLKHYFQKTIYYIQTTSMLRISNLIRIYM